MRRNNIDPAVAADLEALDAVLAGEQSDPDLLLITDEVRASAPRMSPAFAERLDTAVAEGFEGAAPPPRKKRSWRPSFEQALGLGIAGVFALVVSVAALNTDGKNDSDSASGGAQATSIEPERSAQGAAGGSSAEAQSDAAKAAPTPSASAPSADSDAAAGEAAPSTATGAGVTDKNSAIGLDDSTAVPPPGAGPRRIERAADLTISTPIGKLQDTADGVTAVADRLGGYVYTSNVSANGESGQATFDLRIPTDKLDDAMAALSRLGHVRSRNETSQDITARFSSALSRLHDARAERQALLRALADAATQAEIDSINGRLNIARQRIVAAKNDLFAARRASNLARVGVTVLGVGGDEGAAAGDGKDKWTPGDAVRDALHVLSVAASVAIVGLAGAIPAALLLALLFAAWRVQRRRRRELALDANPNPAV
jgi:hypothetical protein